MSHIIKTVTTSKHDINTHSETLAEELRRENNRAKLWFYISIIWIIFTLYIASIILKN